MEFQDAIIFVAAIIVIVAAGVLLGIALGRRGKQQRFIDHDRLEAYVELVEAMDGLRQADVNHKQAFIGAYYRALLFAPDNVVKYLNAFLKTVTANENDYDPSAQAAARDNVAMALRQDSLGELERSTKLKPTDLYSIEVNAQEATASKSDPEYLPPKKAESNS